jgi:hypothetical protein
VPSQNRNASFFLWHLLADDHRMSGLGINPRSDRQATARYGVRVLLLAYHTVFDDLRGRRRHLAANWRRSRRLRRRGRLVLGGTAEQKQKPEQRNDEPRFHRDEQSTQLAQYNPAREAQPIASGMPDCLSHAVARQFAAGTRAAKEDEFCSGRVGAWTSSSVSSVSSVVSAQYFPSRKARGLRGH